MESNWRWNKWLLGLSGAPVSLVARYPPGTNPGSALCKYTGPLQNVAVVAIVDAQGYAYLLQFVPVTPGTRFPYGQNVMPD